MKKYTLLFVIMLAISWMSFGQKEPKLLLEKHILNSYSSLDVKSIRISPSKKIWIDLFERGKIVDKNGDYIPNLGSENSLVDVVKGKNVNWVILQDSIYNLLDSDYNLTKKIIVKGSDFTRFYEVSDGLIYNTKTSTSKFNFEGEKVWKYDFNEKTRVYESKINLFQDDVKFVLLDKKGNKIKEFQNSFDSKNVNYHIFDCPDNGFWLTTSKEFIKYDSTGNLISKTNFASSNPEYIEPFSVFLNSIWKVAKDNSLIVFHHTKEQIFITKIYPDGFKKTVTLKCSIGESGIINEFVNENKVLFNIGNSIGVADFLNQKLSWIKEVDYVHEISQNVFKVSDIQKYTGKVLNIKHYDSFGKLTWLFEKDSISYVQYYKDFVFVEFGKFVSKFNISDSKLIWQHISPEGSYYNFSIDSEGNDYWFYIPKNMKKSTSLQSGKIDFISAKTGKISPFFTYPKDFIHYKSTFLIDNARKEFITFTVESDLDKFNHILRKYSTRCAYDLEATAEATGKTEVCSGTKVKLSTTKQDGLTYQWQKDGKDIPTLKDIVHDVEESGSYTVIVKDENCQNQTTSNPIKVTIKSAPEATILTDTKGVVYEPFTVKMSANSGTNLAYQWLKDDAIIPNETKLTYEAKKSGKYNVIVMQDGCEKRSDALTISILIPLANQEEVGEEVVQVYPNPSKGEFKIILPKSLKSADIQLFDVLGRERSFMYVGEQAQAEGLVQGVYFVRISKGEKSVTSKIIIE